jgi:zinc transporter ZupT
LNNCISIPSKDIDSSDHQIFNDSNFRNKVNNYCSLNENIQESAKSKTIETIGYLNLLANGIDNFSHGLAVAASFITGIKVFSQNI